MLELQLVDPTEYEDTFEEFYDIPWHAFGGSSISHTTEITLKNMEGTLTSCWSFSDFSPSELQVAICEWCDLQTQTIDRLHAIQKWGFNLDFNLYSFNRNYLDKRMAAMRKITEDVVKLDLERKPWLRGAKKGAKG